MTRCKGYVDSVYSGSAVDGRGLRCVVFLSGCNLRCGFCHNPETLYKKGQETSPEELLERILRYKAYIKKGGVTLSGGEPFLQREFVLEACRLFKGESINVCIETNGHIVDTAIISAADSLIVDVKNQEGFERKRYEDFLSAAVLLRRSVRLTNVIVPEKNDNGDCLSRVKALADMIPPELFDGVKFLPFRKLCESKYERLGLEFPYAAYREATADDIRRVTELFGGI